MIPVYFAWPWFWKNWNCSMCRLMWITKKDWAWIKTSGLEKFNHAGGWIY